jgi:hypothetical protein
VLRKLNNLFQIKFVYMYSKEVRCLYRVAAKRLLIAGRANPLDPNAARIAYIRFGQSTWEYSAVEWPPS